MASWLHLANIFLLVFLRAAQRRPHEPGYRSVRGPLRRRCGQLHGGGPSAEEQRPSDRQGGGVWSSLPGRHHRWAVGGAVPFDSNTPAEFNPTLSGREFDVKAKCVINATGPFTDSLRKMDNQETANICQPSAGVHIVIPGYYRWLPLLVFVPRRFLIPVGKQRTRLATAWPSAARAGRSSVLHTRQNSRVVLFKSQVLKFS